MVHCLLELAKEDEGGIDIVKSVLRKQNMRGETALHDAIHGRNVDTVILLLMEDSQLARFPSEGISPLCLAVVLGQYHIAIILHEKDNQLSYSGPDGQNVLHASVLRDIDEMDDGEEENQYEEDQEDEYVPNDDEDDYNSYDHNDDMSEEDVLGEDQVWVVDENNPDGPKLLKAKCRHCNKEYAYVKGSSTSNLNWHWDGKCKKLNAKLANQLIQSRLGFKHLQGNANIHASTTLGHVGFEQAIVKELIAKMIMIHEYSFRMVEHEWFNIVLKYLNPLYQSMERKAIRAECMRVYKKEKETLKVALQDVDYISLTIDLWTSNQTISYMCVVGHYIDEEWNMQTRVLAFMELDPPHSGHMIADAIWDCVTEWKIENKVISITLDNASNNDVAVKDLKEKFIFWRCKQFEETYFHVRCCAHIVNLVVQDGTACMTNLIKNLRETVKYFKKSTSRLHKFVEIF
ncbi:hypothetical protein ACQ4PT_045962 [Festuca glaucescens]